MTVFRSSQPYIPFLYRRIPDRERMRSEVGAWERRRNDSSTPVNWRFRTADA